MIISPINQKFINQQTKVQNNNLVGSKKENRTYAQNTSSSHPQQMQNTNSLNFCGNTLKLVEKISDDLLKNVTNRKIIAAIAALLLSSEMILFSTIKKMAPKQKPSKQTMTGHIQYKDTFEKSGMPYHQG